jgi:hypothetical protein
MTTSVTRSILLLSLLLPLAGCAHRLNGPIHSADGPAWTRPEVEAVPAGDYAIEYRILLIGDAGYYLEDDPTLAALEAWSSGDSQTTAIFLGDNIYNEGLTDDDRERGEQILAQQLAATAARKVVLPGNHDWGLLPRNYNAQSIANQQAFVDGWSDGNAEFIPKEGCMGPVLRTLREADPARNQKAIVLIALDPTPWIQPGIRKACPTATTDEAHLEALDVLLERHAEDHVIVASHYPMLTGGPHGGLTYGFLADMIVTPLGWMMGGLMNTYEPGYSDWIERTQAVFRRHPPALYAAGHDHNLQLLDSGDVAGLFVVSGAGARERVSTVTHLPETIFAHAAEGFVAVDFERTDEAERIVLRVVEPLVSVDEPVFETVLD